MPIGLRIAVYAVMGIVTLVVCVSLFRTGKPLRYAWASLLEGVCAIAAIDVVGIFTGVSLGFGWFSLGVCTVLGIPGVISMLLMRAITLL